MGHSHHKPTDISVRIFLLKNQPIFSKLSSAALHKLAEICHDVSYPEGNTIVSKNEPIDSFFVIVSGKAEVLDDHKNILEILHPGETIGLSHSGFFSKTGLRTADVIAKKPLLALRIELNAFQQFVEAHPEINLEHSAQMTLRLNFIKQIEPFAEADFSKVMVLMDRITPMHIPANHVIFQQGDKADECYFLVQGKVEINIRQSDGVEKNLAELTEPTVFGELSLLKESKRNATAVTRQHTTVLVMKKRDFFDFLKKGNIEEYEIVKLIIDRERFQRDKSTTLHKRHTKEKKEIAILKNNTHGNYMSVSPEALFVWERLDGNHTLQDIALEFYKEYNQIAIDEIADLIMQFIQSGFIQLSTSKHKLFTHPLRWYEKFFFSIKKIMEAHISFKHVNSGMTRLYNKIGYVFYKPFSLAIMCLMTIVGFAGFVYFAPQASSILYKIPNAWLLVVLQSPLLLLIVPLHELAHAMTTTYYGRQVRSFGIGWFWVGPMAFTDTSDMWLSERNPRLAVTFSGIFLNIVLAGLFAVLACMISDGVIAVFCWLFSLTNYLAAWANLDPLLELDGYYLLMDYFDKPNLRAHALTWLIDSKEFSMRYFPEIVYWACCIAFILITALLTFVVQHFVLNHILPHRVGMFPVQSLQWILPLLVIVFSSASLYLLVKRQKKLLSKSF